MELAEAAARVLEPIGFEVLEVRVGSSGRRRRVLVRIDRLDEEVVSMDDVSLASEVFGLELDRLDPFDSPYLLEVESPGGERPLSRPRHFERFNGLLAKVRSDGTTFTARIMGLEGDSVRFDRDGTEATLALSDIDGAWLAEWPAEPR